jgi:hypothetical protein
MGRPDKYRRYAAECLEMASVVHDPTARATLLQMAQVWLRLAGQGELQDAELQDAEFQVAEENSAQGDA